MLDPAVFDAVNEILYVPADVNVYDGFWTVDITVFPFFQDQTVGEFVDWSVNWIVNG